MASSGAQIGNAVGELQEYAMGYSLGMPDYSFSEKFIDGQWMFTATVRVIDILSDIFQVSVPGGPGVCWYSYT